LLGVLVWAFAVAWSTDLSLAFIHAFQGYWAVFDLKGLVESALGRIGLNHYHLIP